MSKFILTVILAVSSPITSSAQELSVFYSENECLNQYLHWEIYSNTLNPQVYAYSLEFQVFSIELIGIAGCSNDSAFAYIKNDTLFLDLLPWQVSRWVDGKEVIAIEFSECSCYHYIKYDIYGLKKTPIHVVFGRDSLILQNIKYKPSVSVVVNGKNQLKTENCGHEYSYQIDQQNSENRYISRTNQEKVQKILFDKDGSLLRIETSTDYGDTYQTFIPH